MDVELLEKTELRIEGIVTSGTNLGEVAAVVARILALPPDKVMVIDVRSSQIALDVLVQKMRAESFFGKAGELLEALRQVPGVTVASDAEVHSAGILGAIALSEADATVALEKSVEMGREIQGARCARVCVFPTGFELQEGRIVDTNTPYLVKIFEEAGFLATSGDALADSLEKLVEALGKASEQCGLVVTTGGVGAEDKDFSVEAIEKLDAAAATPYLVRFTRGEGRHVKDGIRIGVGMRDNCLLVALPGPHDEVRRVGPVLVRGFKAGWSRELLAERLADAVRAKFHAAAGDHHSGHAGHVESTI